jgi:hypothetical protein
MTIDVEKPTFIEDQTLDEIPDNFDEAEDELAQDPEPLIDEPKSKFQGKIEFLTRIITQNIYSGRIEAPDDRQHPDFKNILKAKFTVMKYGNIPSNTEEYNEIARRHTKIHPAVETRTNFF